MASETRQRAPPACAAPFHFVSWPQPAPEARSRFLPTRAAYSFEVPVVGLCHLGSGVSDCCDLNSPAPRSYCFPARSSTSTVVRRLSSRVSHIGHATQKYTVVPLWSGTPCTVPSRSPCSPSLDAPLHASGHVVVTCMYGVSWFPSPPLADSGKESKL